MPNEVTAEEHEKALRRLIEAGLTGLTEGDRTVLIMRALQASLDMWRMSDAAQKILEQAMLEKIREALRTPEMQQYMNERAIVALKTAMAAVELRGRY